MASKGTDRNMTRVGHKLDENLPRLTRSWPAALSGAFGLLALTACGTDVQWLLKRDSKLVAEADEAATAAEALDPDLATPLYDAEDVKREACQSIYASISELMQRRPSFGEQLASDLGLFVAYVVPFEEIERCAEAQAAYGEAVEELKMRLASRQGSESD